MVLEKKKKAFYEIYINWKKHDEVQNKLTQRLSCIFEKKIKNAVKY